MKYLIITISFFIASAFQVNSQNREGDRPYLPENYVKKSGLFGGYSFNFGEKPGSYNVVELGIARTKIGGVEPTGYSYYAGSDFLFNSSKFSFGPKIGASVTFWMITLGGELIYYTDFHDKTLHLAPYLAFGSGMTKLHFRYHIPLYNKQYAFINDVSVGITFFLPFKGGKGGRMTGRIAGK